MNYNKIITDENLMETIQHGDKEYPFRFYYDNLALFELALAYRDRICLCAKRNSYFLYWNRADYPVGRQCCFHQFQSAS